MFNRLQPLREEQLATLHNACMRLLSKVGIVFHSAEAIEIFKHHGFNVDGRTVYFSEDEVLKALETVPSEFIIQARNPDKSVKVGGEQFALGPCWGAPHVVEANGARRSASMEDQNTFCKLAQTSPYLDLVAGSMAVATDFPPDIAAAKMLVSCFILTDMPVIANPCNRVNGDEIVKLAQIAFGGNLTDSFSLYMQAGTESALALTAGLLCGVHFVHQACGILGAYSAISFEKFVVDEETCGILKRALNPVEITDKSINLDLIETVGTSGSYLMMPETAMHCRTAFFPYQLAQRGTYEDWQKNELGDTLQLASNHIQKRLAAYVKPDNDPVMERDLEKYVANM